jgi:hypothetical protein
MPKVVVIEVSDSLIERTEDLRIQLGAKRFRAGVASNWDRSTWAPPGLTLDYLPQELLARVSDVQTSPESEVEIVCSDWSSNPAETGKCV